jgi:drug/metabolite transporter (DMT)-like permease
VIGSGHSNSASGQPSSTGDLMVVASLATSIVWTLTSKKLMERHRSLEVSVYSTLSGFVMLAAWVLLSPLALNPGAHLRIAAPPVHFSATAWTALIFSGLLCTATTTLLWNWGIHRVPASRAGVFLNLEPAIGAWLGMQFLGERLGAWAWVGGALILTSALALTARGLKTQPDLILD